LSERKSIEYGHIEQVFQTERLKLGADEDNIFPDPMSESVAESWRSGPGKTLEREYTALVPAEPLAAERREQ